MRVRKRGCCALRLRGEEEVCVASFDIRSLGRGNGFYAALDHTKPRACAPVVIIDRSPGSWTSPHSTFFSPFR